MIYDLLIKLTGGQTNECKKPTW